MKARGILVSLVVMALAWTLRARPGQPSAQIQRGKYLVESVAMCGDCHKPRNEKGEPIQEKWLHGSPLPFKPAVPIPAWADKTPKIAGLPGWEDNDAIRFLMTGLAYNDLPARPPMPQNHPGSDSRGRLPAFSDARAENRARPANSVVHN